MIIDARTLPDGTRLRTSACIVGAGPVGLALARALAKSGIDALVVEAGGLKVAEDTEALSFGEIGDDVANYPALHLYRRRVVGGTSFVWGGRCVPLDPIDFERRPWWPGSGWPIGFDDLKKWYEDASEFLETGEFEYDAKRCVGNKHSLVEGFSSDVILTDSVERFSRPTNVGARYRRELTQSKKIRLLHHAVCTDIRLTACGRQAEGCRIKTLAGTELSLDANTVIVAAGTIETVRLLFASNSVLHDGIGNHSGWLGRNYITHLEGTVGQFSLRPQNRRVKWGYEKSCDGVYVRRRFSLSNVAQHEHRLGNAIARITHAPVADPGHGSGILSAAFLVKNLLVPEYAKRIAWTDRLTAERLAALGRAGLLRQHLWNVLRDLPNLALFGPWWLWARNLSRRQMPSLTLPSRKGTYPLDFNVEQAPNRDSYIGISSERDRFGVPVATVNWRTSALDRENLLKTVDVFRKSIHATACGEFSYDKHTLTEQFTPIGGHQIGGTRMAAEAGHGVVDSNCRVHGTANLYVVGNQVFPTAGHANPTLTSVALALRLSAHLTHASI